MDLEVTRSTRVGGTTKLFLLYRALLAIAVANDATASLVTRLPGIFLGYSGARWPVHSRASPHPSKSATMVLRAGGARMSSIAQVKEAARTSGRIKSKWPTRKRASARTLTATPHQLIGCGPTGCNLNCGKLSQWETQRLPRAWCAVFGDWPPCDDDADDDSHRSPAPHPNPSYKTTRCCRRRKWCG